MEQINEVVVAVLLDQYRRRLPLLPRAVVAVSRLVRPACSRRANRPSGLPP
jgi:hypothetical protein